MNVIDPPRVLLVAGDRITQGNAMMSGNYRYQLILQEMEILYCIEITHLSGRRILLARVILHLSYKTMETLLSMPMADALFGYKNCWQRNSITITRRWKSRHLQQE